MAVKLEKDIIELVNSPETLKILATVDENNVPHAAFKGSLHVNEEGNLEFLELLESSTTYRNFTRSLWYEGKVAVTFKGADNRSFQIKGRPEKIVISGPVFEKNYIRLRERRGDVELAAVCIIKPEEVSGWPAVNRFAEQESKRPFFKHLDRLAK